jgi:citrate lyase subunit beta/citryl-CoA lyase
MVPKATPASLAELSVRAPSLTVVALVETADGVAACRETAGMAGVIRIALGHLDLAAELGVDPENGLALLWARSSLVNASAAFGLAPPIDGVTANITDLKKVHRDAGAAKRLGFGGKLLIHPAHLETALQAFQPTAAELAWAEQVISVMSGGASALDGQMIDPPVIRRAQRILTSARQAVLWRE